MNESTGIYGVVMRWQQLFADLAAQFEEAEATAERAELPSRARTEHGAVRLDQRLRGAVGATVIVRCRGAGPLPGVLVDAGPDWLLLEDAGRESLIAGSAVLAVDGGGGRAGVAGGGGAGPVGPAPCGACPGAGPQRRSGGAGRRGPADRHGRPGRGRLPRDRGAPAGGRAAGRRRAG